ncbi:MAG: NAD-dependent dihydropyrimidine dehydrogenase subunit PreA [Anaerolineae bacterium]
MSKSKLQTEFLGISFPNPFLLGSGPPTTRGEMIKEAFKAGWGGAVLKTIALQPTTDPCPRLHILRQGRRIEGMVNIELITELSLQRWEDEIDLIRDAYPSRPIIASIMGGANPDEWQEVVRRLEPHGVNAFEMNVSCPNFAEGRGAQLGQDPEFLALAISWVREATQLPVIAKLTPNVTDIVSLARVAKEAGADAITATNTLSGLAGIDLETFSPLPSVEGIGIFGGYSGPGLKPVSLRCAASIAKGVDIPLVGCGGVSTWQDAAEYIAVGASLVQVCSAVMWRGYSTIDKLTRGLEGYLDEHGCSSPADIEGKALPQIVTLSDLDISVRLLAEVDEDKCTGCEICVRACASGAYQAIDMVGDVASANREKCDGCGLCVGLCPVDAITLVSR